MLTKIISFVFIFSSAAFAGNLVEFHIPNGTNQGAWNSEETMVTVSMGDTLRIINDDSVNHQLHTSGSPCSHGSLMKPGGYYDCKIQSTYSIDEDGALYDHLAGPNAAFYIEVLN